MLTFVSGVVVGWITGPLLLVGAAKLFRRWLLHYAASRNTGIDEKQHVGEQVLAVKRDGNGKATAVENKQQEESTGR